ncbi:response regulator [Pseudanabaena biceps]|nr:response regulator [Pseudanabaena biceps]
MDTDNLAVYSLIEQLRGYGRKQFTGKLELYSSKNYKWNIYYCHGRLVWASGGGHNHRRWRRLMAVHKVQVDFSKISFRSTKEMKLWDYQVLVIFMRRLLLTREQITPIIETFIQEVLFDIIQCAANEMINSYCDLEDEVTPVIALIHAESAIDRAYQEWLLWRKVGVADFSPNLSPWIKRPTQLKEEASELTHKTLITILDGRRSLRELSAWLKKDLLTLTQSLMAYYYRGMVGLAEVPDIESPVAEIFREEINRTQIEELVDKTLDQQRLMLPSLPLVACVDDSKQVCTTIEQIVTDFGFGFLGIHESIRVLPLLIEHKPEVIILDLVMPIVGGYELCTQIRRIPDFKATPILILTSNDTLVDRIRAKFVGATAFVSKTAGNDKIGKQIQKHLSMDAISFENTTIDTSDTSSESNP